MMVLKCRYDHTPFYSLFQINVTPLNYYRCWPPIVYNSFHTDNSGRLFTQFIHYSYTQKTLTQSKCKKDLNMKSRWNWIEYSVIEMNWNEKSKERKKANDNRKRHTQREIERAKDISSLIKMDSHFNLLKLRCDS